MIVEQMELSMHRKNDPRLARELNLEENVLLRFANVENFYTLIKQSLFEANMRRSREPA